MELPEDLAKRHADRLLGRTLVNLQYRGAPVAEIENRLDEIRSASAAQSARDLKLTFILDRIASKEKVEVTDAEVDARVRFIAAQYGRRADRVREDMQAKGTLESLRGQIQEDKVIRMLLDKAKVAGEPEKPAASAADAQKPQEASEPQAQSDAPETT
jgi:trigger factor